jgi:hypothetical protein
MALVAKPYVVRVIVVGGEEREFAVVAYDVMEALQSAGVAASAEAVVVEKILSIRPDEAALKAAAMPVSDALRAALVKWPGGEKQ